MDKNVKDCLTIHPYIFFFFFFIDCKYKFCVVAGGSISFITICEVSLNKIKLSRNINIAVICRQILCILSAMN